MGSTVFRKMENCNNSRMTACIYCLTALPMDNYWIGLPIMKGYEKTEIFISYFGFIILFY